MCCERARAAGWGASGGRGGCAAAPAERPLLARRRGASTDIGLGTGTKWLCPPRRRCGVGMLARVSAVPGGFSPSRRLSRPRGGMRARCSAPRQFRERDDAPGVTGQRCQCGAGEAKQGHPCPISCLHPLPAEVGDACWAAGPGILHLSKGVGGSVSCQRPPSTKAGV